MNAPRETTAELTDASPRHARHGLRRIVPWVRVLRARARVRCPRALRPVAGAVSLTALLAAALLVALSAGEALARGGSQGLHWGYRPPAGSPINQMWLLASPWSALNGGGIPHRNLGPADLNMGGQSPRSYGSHGTFSGQRSFAPVDRSVMFPGSSSQTSSAASVRPIRFAPPTDRVYRPEVHNNPPYYHNYNGYWLLGYWGGGLRGWTRWDEALGSWSFPRWEPGMLYYFSGYGQYRNPFLSDKPSRGPSYARPIEIRPDNEDDYTSTSADPDPTVRPIEVELEEARRALVRSPEVSEGLKSFEAARDAFRKKDYDTSLERMNDALRALPSDPALHEFRGLVLFARGEYQEAAATTYAVLSVSPGWNWTTLSSLYADPEEYTKQLRQLETYRKEHPQSADASFLLAYHYVTCRHNAAAVKHFHNVAKLLSDDELVPHLAALVSGIAEKESPSQSAASHVGESASDKAAAKPKEEEPALEMPDLIATWRAKRDESTSIELTFGADRRFVWVATVRGETRRIDGTYEFDGSRVLLSSPRGSMIGVLTPRAEGGFHFRMLENAPPTAGLEFNK